MIEKNRPRRSALYVPGSNTRALEKARELDADVLIMDLEDSVAPNTKKKARNITLNELNKGGYDNHELIIRINGVDTEWGIDDIIAFSKATVDGFLIPKVNDAQTIISTIDHLNRAGVPQQTPLWCMMETPEGILHCNDIAKSSARITALVMGTTDLITDLRGRDTFGREALLTSLGLCLLTARAHKLSALDGVYMDLSDEKGFISSCNQGRNLGFDGKTLIHPKTLKNANEIFGPQLDELEYAERVISAYNEAEKQGNGVTLLDGKLIEHLHVTEAKRLIQLEETISSRYKN